MRPLTKRDSEILMAIESLKGEELGAALFNLIVENRNLKDEVEELKRKVAQNQLRGQVTPELVEALRKRIQP